MQSPETHLQYRVDRLIGQGGFGQAYLARRIGRSGVVPPVVCVKVSTRKDGWLREAYFGQLLDDHERAIRVFDAFPLIGGDGRVHYYLVLDTPNTAISARSCAAAARAGPRRRCGVRSPASWTCCASCTAARCCTAISHR